MRRCLPRAAARWGDRGGGGAGVACGCSTSTAAPPHQPPWRGVPEQERNSGSGGTGDGVAAPASLPPHLAALRRFNAARPGVVGQVVLARVLRVGPDDTLLVDPGYHGTVALSAHAFRGSRVHDASGAATGRLVEDGVEPAEYVTTTVARCFTPSGDMELAPHALGPEARDKLRWEELAAAAADNAPVWGRVLNRCMNGYAVGVGGLVAALPFARCAQATADKVGVLQPFYIVSMDAQRRIVSLCDQTHRPQAYVKLTELYSNI